MQFINFNFIVNCFPDILTRYIIILFFNIYSDSDFFANMVVEAVSIVKQSDGKGGHKYPINAIRVLKANGKSMRESMLINGFALNCVIAMQGMGRNGNFKLIL